VHCVCYFKLPTLCAFNKVFSKVFKCAQFKFLIFSFNLWSRFMFLVQIASFPICVCAFRFLVCVLRLCSYLCSSSNPQFDNNSRFLCVCECMFIRFLASIGSTITTSNNVGFLIVVGWRTTKVSRSLCLCFPFMGVLQVCVHISYVCVGGLIRFQATMGSIVITNNNIGFPTTPS
jgi:hypothetical protein